MVNPPDNAVFGCQGDQLWFVAEMKMSSRRFEFESNAFFSISFDSGIFIRNEIYKYAKYNMLYIAY